MPNANDVIGIAAAVAVALIAAHLLLFVAQPDGSRFDSTFVARQR
jgi:hypothetical protein